MSLDELRPLLVDVVRYDEADELLLLLREIAEQNGQRANIECSLLEAVGDMKVTEDGSTLDELKEQVVELSKEVEHVEEERDTEKEEHDETKEELEKANLRIDELKEEIADMRRAQANGEPLPPPRPEPPPVDVKLVVAQKMADALTEIGVRYQQAALKAGGRTAAGKAANALAFELRSAAETERAKIPR